METTKENTVQEAVTINQNPYNFNNILAMTLSLSLIKNMFKNDIVDQDELKKITKVIVSNHGLKTSTIYALLT